MGAVSGEKGKEKSPVVLLVDDSEDDVFLLERALAASGHAHRLVHLSDGQEAIDYLTGTGKYEGLAPEMPDLMLLDLKMPRVAGLEVLAWLRTQPQLAKIPVVVLTASTLESDEKEAGALGIVGYEVKPMDYDRLIGIARRLGEKWLRN